MPRRRIHEDGPTPMVRYGSRRDRSRGSRLRAHGGDRANRCARELRGRSVVAAAPHRRRVSEPRLAGQARRHPRHGSAPDPPGLNKQVAGELSAAEKIIKVIGAGSWRKCTPSHRWTGSDDRKIDIAHQRRWPEQPRGGTGPAGIGPKPHIFRSGNQSRLGPTRSSFPAESAAQTLARGSLAKGHGRR